MRLTLPLLLLLYTCSSAQKNEVVKGCDGPEGRVGENGKVGGEAPVRVCRTTEVEKEKFSSDQPSFQTFFLFCYGPAIPRPLPSLAQLSLAPSDLGDGRTYEEEEWSLAWP